MTVSILIIFLNEADEKVKLISNYKFRLGEAVTEAHLRNLT